MYKTICAYKLTNANSRLSPSARKSHSKFPFPKCKFVILNEIQGEVLLGSDVLYSSPQEHGSLLERICFRKSNFEGQSLSRSMQIHWEDFNNYISRKENKTRCLQQTQKRPIRLFLFVSFFHTLVQALALTEDGCQHLFSRNTQMTQNLKTQSTVKSLAGVTIVVQLQGFFSNILLFTKALHMKSICLCNLFWLLNQYK